jgi:hypothetical protein
MRSENIPGSARASRAIFGALAEEPLQPRKDSGLSDGERQVMSDETSRLLNSALDVRRSAFGVCFQILRN